MKKVLFALLVLLFSVNVVYSQSEIQNTFFGSSFYALKSNVKKNLKEGGYKFLENNPVGTITALNVGFGSYEFSYAAFFFHDDMFCRIHFLKAYKTKVQQKSKNQPNEDNQLIMCG